MSAPPAPVRVDWPRACIKNTQGKVAIEHPVLACCASLSPMPTPAVAWCPGGLASANAGAPLRADSAASIHADDAAKQTCSRTLYPPPCTVGRRVTSPPSAGTPRGGGGGETNQAGNPNSARHATHEVGGKGGGGHRRVPDARGVRGGVTGLRLTVVDEAETGGNFHAVGRTSKLSGQM